MATSESGSIKAKVIELLSRMGFDAEIFERQEEGRLVLNIKTPDAQLLIGKQGANLEALQHVMHLLSRKIPEAGNLHFALDVDDYKEKRVIYLKELARKAAHQVRSSRRSLMLPPMPASERRAVHNYLSLFSDILSQSTGEEPNRRVVIKTKTVAKSADEFNFIENS
jgi:spoIIIJ-associated protein